MSERGTEAAMKAYCAPLWCPNQDQLPALNVTYRVKNLRLIVILGYLRLRWVVKSVH